MAKRKKPGKKIKSCIFGFLRCFKLVVCNFFPGVYFLKGEIHRLRGELEKAIQAYKRGIKIGPNHVRMHAHLGIAYYNSQHYEEAIQAFKRAIEIRPDDTEARTGLGHAYGKLGLTQVNQHLYEEAIETFKKGIRSSPDNLNHHYNLGLVYEKLGNHKEAIKAFKKAIKIKRDCAPAHNSLGIAYKDMGRYKKAIQAFKQAVSINPDDVKPRYNLGLACQTLGRHKEAIEAFKKVVELKPGFAEARCNLGISYCHTARWEEAIKALKEAVKLNENDARAYASLGISYSNLGFHKKAMQSYKKAISIKPDDVEARHNLGHAYHNLGRYDEAIETYKQIIKTEPDNEKIHVDLGFTYREAGRYEQAIQSCMKAIEIKPQYTEAYINLGQIYADLDRWEEALEAYKQAVKISPNGVESHVGLGICYHNLGSHKEAVQTFTRATKIKPTNAEGYCSLGLAYAELGHFKKAAKAFQQAIEMKPCLAEAHRGLGAAYYNLGSYEQAIEALKQAIKIRPNFWGTHYYLGECYLESADYEKAIESANRAIELATHDVKSMIPAIHAVVLRGCIHEEMLMYSEASSDFHQAICFARRANYAKGIESFLQGLYYWASGIKCYVNNQYEKAKLDLQSALVAFKKNKNRLLMIRSAELVLESIDIDDEITKLAKVRNIESLRSTVEDVLTKVEDWNSALGTIAGGIAKELPRGLLNVLLAKHNIVRLLADVLNGKPLDDVAFIDASETLEKFLDGDWSRRFESIGILLRKLARCKNFEEMKKAEHDILHLTPDLLAIDGPLTKQALKYAPLEATKLLKQQIEQTRQLTMHLIDFQRQPSSVLKPETKQITFTNTSVLVGGEDWRKGAPLLLAEYIILKQKEVHWLWAYIILPKLEVKTYTPCQQFKNYISKIRKKLEKCGMRLAILKHEEEGFAIYEGADDRVISNIRDATETYEKALSVRESNLKKAVEVLSSIIENGNKNRWYSFTDAYMTLSRWICELEFEKVSDLVIERCKTFFEWYLKRLSLGISKINRYRAEEGLDDVSLAEFEKIKSELREASGLYSALVERRPLDKEEQGYESFVNVLLHAREALVSVMERSLGSEGEQNNSIKVIKLLADKSKDLAEVVQYGRDALDQLLERKRQRHKYSEEAIHDMHEDIYWELGNVILEIENFDKFEQKRGNKLRHLKKYLYSRLRHKLAKYE